MEDEKATDNESADTEIDLDSNDWAKTVRTCIDGLSNLSILYIDALVHSGEEDACTQKDILNIMQKHLSEMNEIRRIVILKFMFDIVCVGGTLEATTSNPDGNVYIKPSYIANSVFFTQYIIAEASGLNIDNFLYWVFSLALADKEYLTLEETHKLLLTIGIPEYLIDNITGLNKANTDIRSGMVN